MRWSLRQMADRQHLGLRVLLRLHERRDGPVLPSAVSQHVARHAPRTPEQGYQLTEDIADQAIGWINSVNATDPKKPWFLYFSTSRRARAAPRAPGVSRQVQGAVRPGLGQISRGNVRPAEELGVIPADAKLTPRPKEIPAWDDQSAEAKKVFARLMENYTGYLEYTDAQIGRVIDAVAASGELDNTLIIYIVGDNGASAEGGLEGPSTRSRASTGSSSACRACWRSTTRSAARKPSRTFRSPGRGPRTRPSNGPSRSRRTSVERATRW